MMHRSATRLRVDRLAPLAGWTVLLVGLCGFLGWVIDQPHLKGLAVGGITIKTNTTICLMLLGAGLVLLRPENAGPIRRRLGQGCAWAAMALAAAIMFQHVTGADLNIDQLLFREPAGERATASPNRMGPPACLSVIAGGVGLLCLGRLRGQVSQGAAVIVAIITAIPIMGYAYDITPLYGISRLTGIAFHTAAALMLFAIGLFAARPGDGAMAIVTSEYAGGIMARSLLLPALFLPFLIGWSRTLGEQAGLIDPYLGRPLMITILTLILVGLIFRNARHMSALEVRRIAAEREKAEELARNAEALEKARAAAESARELAEQASRAKSDFLATLSHEMRTPLSPVVLTLAEMAKHPEFPEALRADLELVRHNLQLETRLISDLLDLTRIERQKMELERVNVDLHRVLRDTVAVCATGGGAPVLLDLRATRPWVNGDDTRLRQVFWNLLDNARKFTPPSGTITIATDEPNPGHIRVRIIDTGQGIPPEITERLFNAFEQGPARHHGQRRGLGLGLSIARRLIEAHHGTIAAASAGEGLGATFIVELPALASIPATAPAVAGGPAANGRPQRILLVEDHPSTLAVMKKLLTRLGHQVSTATTVAEAVQLGNTENFDVLLSDVGLPDGTGHDVVRLTHARFRGRAIALSGYGAESDVRASQEQGFTLHLIKPVDLAAIQKALQQVSGASTPPVSVVHS